jgi:hypothetical protein
MSDNTIEAMKMAIRNVESLRDAIYRGTDDMKKHLISQQCFLSTLVAEMGNREYPVSMAHVAALMIVPQWVESLASSEQLEQLGRARDYLLNCIQLETRKQQGPLTDAESIFHYEMIRHSYSYVLRYCPVDVDRKGCGCHPYAHDPEFPNNIQFLNH